MPAVAAPIDDREPGSFRDRGARVFYRDGAVLRGLDSHAYRDWQYVRDRGVCERFVREGRMVASEEVNEAHPEWAAVLRHEPIEFISYPYEWCFDMLRDAALLHLELLLSALDDDCTLQDASPYNVQWRGVAPMLIDVASLKPLHAGETWVGYRQFCQLFLYPLFLQAYKGLSFHPWLRGSLDGITPAQCLSVMSLRDLVRAGVFTHVYLHASAQQRLAATHRNLRSEVKLAGFSKGLIQANARRMHRLVQGLRWDADESAWSGYAQHHTYSTDDEGRKTAFVLSVAERRKLELVWDLGCNTGEYSRLIAARARYVVAMDADHLSVARLYRRLRAEQIANVLPLVVDLADPSPNLGWRGVERKALPERGRPSLILCLALIHHMAISRNLPLEEFIEWLAQQGDALIIEFVDRDDPMVQRLLRDRDDECGDYNLANFEASLRRHCTVVEELTLCDGKRRLYYALPA